MTHPLFFDQPDEMGSLPEGMRYRAQLIAPPEETALLTRVRELPFKEFEFHGHKGKRRTVSFGWQYEFSGRGRLQKANDIPEFILPLRAIAAKFAHMEPESLQHVLVIEYGPGAGIGWHRDKPVFGEVIGISLLAPCVLRFRRKVAAEAFDKDRPRKRATWQRVNLPAEPCSAYHLTGPARSEWQHSILSVDQLRYSITFRNLHAL
jgi:alkylated DNA repair dioxygenase AlkB